MIIENREIKTKSIFGYDFISFGGGSDECSTGDFNCNGTRFDEVALGLGMVGCGVAAGSVVGAAACAGAVAAGYASQNQAQRTGTSDK